MPPPLKKGGWGDFPPLHNEGTFCMKPAFSVIFFTVGSGAGLGLFSLLVLADLLGIGGPILPGQYALVGTVALGLVAFGLVSSTFHLANPKNAWRAFSRFGSSWLSREGIFAVLFFPVALIYLGTGWLESNGGLHVASGVAGLLLAWATVYSTGMIYGCLKTIRQWHTPLVPALYMVLAHSSGALLFWILMAASGNATPAFRGMAIGGLLLGALLKAIYYAWIARPGMGPSLNTATGLNRGTVRLLDAGHSHGNFVTQEFGFNLARENAAMLKGTVFVLGFLLPSALLLAEGVALAGVAALSGIAGLLVERWLFFAEARHVVRLYHGQTT